MAEQKLLSIYGRIGEAIGESLENVCNMQEEERQGLIVTLGLEDEVKKITQGTVNNCDDAVDISDDESDNALSLFERISQAIGESVASVEAMSRAEKTQLITVLGLEKYVKDEEEHENTPSTVIDVADLSTDSDEDVLVKDETGTVRGWGECPVCSQLLPNSKLQLHAMACQGIEFNGGDGLEVNPMEVQTKCSMCDCLVPDLVMEEHRETCWGNNSNKRRIETPMERRRNKYPKTTYWASAPKK